MAAKNTLPRYEPDAATAALYLTLAENKAAMDRAKRSIAELDRQVLAALGGREAQVDLPGAHRLVTVRKPGYVSRRARPDARKTVMRRRPDLAARVVSEVTPSRRTVARINAATWTDLAADYSGTLTLDAPVSRRTLPAAAALIRQAREFLADARKEDAALRDELDTLLLDSGLVGSASGFIHRVPGGGEFTVRPTTVTQRLNTAALRDLDPDLYAAVTKEVSVDEAWEVSVVPVADLTGGSEADEDAGQ